MGPFNNDVNLVPPPSVHFAAQPCNRHHRHSYAFAVAGSLADRACIADARKGGTPSPIKLSPQDMLSCGTVKHGKICVLNSEVCVCVRVFGSSYAIMASP